MLKKLSQNKKKITYNTWLDFIRLLIIFNLPSFFFSFFINKKNLFDGISHTKNSFIAVTNSIFFHRPFPDPFVISIDLLCLTLLVIIIEKQWIKKISYYLVSTLFFYQWYSFFVIFFFNREPNFSTDFYFLTQIQYIIDFKILIIILAFLSLFFVFSKILLNQSKKLFNSQFSNKFKRELSSVLIISIIGLSFLNYELKPNQKEAYFTIIQASTINLIKNIEQSLTKTTTEKLTSRLQIKEKNNVILSERPNIYLMIIESYGDMENILDKANLSLFNKKISSIKNWLIQQNIHSISSYSKHEDSGTFGNINTLMYGQKFNKNDLSKLNDNLIKNFKSPTNSLNYLLKQSNYTTIGFYPSLSEKSLTEMSYSKADFKHFYQFDYVFTGTNIHHINSEQSNWYYPDQLSLNWVGDQLNTNISSPHVMTYISSNSHFPFIVPTKEYNHLNNIEKIKSKKYIALQIDKALKIEKQKYNVMFLREQFNQSFLWKIGRWCYPLWEKQKVLFQKLNYQTRYQKAISYQLDSITTFISKINNKPFILIVTGDHQPHFANQSNFTPLHIISNNKEYLDYWQSTNQFEKGFHLNTNKKLATSHKNIANDLLKSLISR